MSVRNVRRDLWNSAQRLIELEAAFTELTHRFEAAEQEITSLRLKVEVLQSHDEKRNR